VPGNVDSPLFKPTTDETREAYRMAPAQRPYIVHDNGHLSMGKRAPTLSDYASLAEWKAILVGAEALRPDLTDGVAASRHFLEGNSKPRVFSYERYVMSDASGQATLALTSSGYLAKSGHGQEPGLVRPPASRPS